MNPGNKILIVVMFLMVVMGNITAQSSNSSATLEALRELSEHYRQQEFLSFDVQYKYSPEKEPGQYLDSLQGSMKLNGTQYWCKMDSTEFITNSQFAIALFNEDKIMYISKPVAASNSMNPIVLLDSILNQNPGIQSQVVQNKTQRRITLTFPPNQKYKRIEYVINLKTGFLDKIITIVHASQLYDNETQKLLDNEQMYVSVETLFSQYQTAGFNKNCFESAHYFQQKDDNNFSVTPAFSQYQIFIGSPELQ